MKVAGTSAKSLGSVCPPRSSPEGLPQCLGGHVRAETGPPAAQPASEGSRESPKEALGHAHPLQPVSVALSMGRGEGPGPAGTGVGGWGGDLTWGWNFFSFHLLMEVLGFSLQASPHTCPSVEQIPLLPSRTGCPIPLPLCKGQWMGPFYSSAD